MFSTRIYQVFLVEIVLSMYRLNATCGTGLLSKLTTSNNVVINHNSPPPTTTK